MSEREAYLAALGIAARGKRRRRQLRAALARAHELRRFEIENYWRRATCAWGFQATALVALGFALSGARGLVGPATAFGALAALTAALTARGSKLWQENWETHVDLLEQEVEGRLMQTVLVRGYRSGWSVSRVNERFLWLLAAGWSLGFLASLLMLGNDRLAIGQAACELIAFGIAGWWLIDARTSLRRHTVLRLS